MSEDDWSEFFDHLDSINNLDHLTWQQRAELVRRKAKEHGGSTEAQLEEFISWFQEP